MWFMGGCETGQGGEDFGSSEDLVLKNDFVYNLRPKTCINGSWNLFYFSIFV